MEAVLATTRELTQAALAKTSSLTIVGDGKANFTFNVHVTADEAARLGDNSLLTCLKKQHRKTSEEQEGCRETGMDIDWLEPLDPFADKYVARVLLRQANTSSAEKIQYLYVRRKIV